MFTKRNIIIAAVVIVVVLAAGVWVGLRFMTGGQAGASDYSAVYLTSGDIYFGKLSWFPRPTLKNVWFLQRGTDQQNQPQLGVAPLSSVFWGPSDEIYLNPEEIIMWTRLDANSEFAKALANPSSVQPAAQGAQSPAANFKGPSTPPPAK